MFLKPKLNKIKIAYIISRIFDPIILLLPLGIVSIFSHHVDGYNRLFWAFILVIFLGILPIITVWLGLKKGKISDIDFTDRHQRTPYIVAIIFYWFLAVILIWSLSGPDFILRLIIAAITIGLIVMSINFFWKISNHSLIITASSFFVNMLYDWKFVWIFILIPVVCWSRLIQKKHTVLQLFGGVMLGILFFLIMRWFGY